MKIIFNTITMSMFVASVSGAVLAKQPHSVTVPMKLTEKGHVYIDTQLNDLQGHPMILDTAATVGVIPNSILKQLALPAELLEIEQVTDATSVVNLTQAIIRSTSVKGLEVHDLPYVTQDLTGLADSNGQIPGILGYGFLATQCTLFDFKNKTVTFHKKHCPKSSIQALKSAKFRLDNDFIKLNVMFNGQSVEAVLDTGAPYNIINSHLLAKLKVDVKEKDELKGLNSKVIAKQKLGEVTYQLAGYQISSHNMVVSDLPVFKALGYENKPVLLMGLTDFKNGSLAIDYDQQTIYF